MGQLEAADYVLAPYLESSLMIANAGRYTDAQMRDFLQRYPESWVGERLRLNWINTVRARGQYADYVELYVPGTGNTIQRCFYAEALHRIGQEEAAYAVALPLWLVPTSQIDQCDEIFRRWRRADAFSEEFIWQRFLLARRAGERRMADYLSLQVRDPAIRLRLQGYERIVATPSVIAQTAAFIEGGSDWSGVISQGVRNLADRDLDEGLRVWEIYRASGVVTATESAYAVDGLLRLLLDRRGPAGALQFATANVAHIADSGFERATTAALASLDWQLTLSWIEIMPETLRNNDQWTYWRARSMNQIGIGAADLYQRVRGERSYYGFLASMLNDQPFSLRELAPDPSLAVSVPSHRMQAWEQTAELEAVGYTTNARLTWQHANRGLSSDQIMEAAEWAAERRLYYLSIRATIDAAAWDRLDVRFPIAYLTAFQAAANETGLPLPWMYAVSRQESSFAADIASPAGARGLMQLMPATARETARRVNLRWDDSLLVDPNLNVRVGALYLHQVYTQFGHNAIYATAAYNAGPSRVRSWLTNGRDQLPLDVWVETIPFTETRNYVKNVMAFAVIYAAKLAQPSPLELMNTRIFVNGNGAAAP